MGCVDIRESAYTRNNFVAVSVIVAQCKWAIIMSEIKYEIDISNNYETIHTFVDFLLFQIHKNS